MHVSNLGTTGNTKAHFGAIASPSKFPQAPGNNGKDWTRNHKVPGVKYIPEAWVEQTEVKQDACGHGIPDFDCSGGIDTGEDVFLTGGTETSTNHKVH